MANETLNRVDEVLFSFSYPRRRLASQCNQKLDQLASISLIPSIESAFDSMSLAGIELEIDSLTVDLGKLSKQEINHSLGDRIKLLLVEALQNEIRERVGLNTSHPSSIDNNKSTDWALLAVQSFFLKGYFPAWLDKSWTLFSILDELISFSGPVFGELVGKLIQKGEVIRKRIAFLDKDYFDRIVRILVPEEAEWILGYRASYLSVHQVKSELPSSSENIKKALNLFILNFIALESGPRFNRFNFSDYFLKSVASHYNLDFDIFIQEIARIAKELPAKNYLDQNFKEAILWVEERNTKEQYIRVSDPDISLEELVHWLNFSTDHPKILTWIAIKANAGPLFNTLDHLFPQFWNRLSSTGFKNLIRYLAGKDAALWEDMAFRVREILPKYSDHSDRNSSHEQFKELFELAKVHASSVGFTLLDTRDWYEILALYFVKKTKFNSQNSELQTIQKYVQLGLDQGIFEAPLIWKKVVHHSSSGPLLDRNIYKESSQIGKEKEFLKKENSPGTTPLKITEMILWEYLRSGVLKSSFAEVNQDDLVLLMGNILREKNKVLLEWLKHPISRNNPQIAKRIWRMIEGNDRSDFQEYLKRFGGVQTLQLLTISTALELVFSPDQASKKGFDRSLWIIFFKELTGGFQKTSGTGPAMTLSLLQSSLGILQQEQKFSYQQRKTLSALQKNLDYKKRLLFYLILNPKSKNLFETLGKSFLFNPKRNTLDKSLLSWAKLEDRGRLGFSFRLLSGSIEPFEALNELMGIESQSIHQVLSGDTSLAKVKREVDLILSEDIKLLLGSNGKNFLALPIRERKEKVDRIILGVQARPKVVKEFFEKYLAGLSIAISFLKGLMSDTDWKFFSEWMKQHFSKPLHLLELSREDSSFERDKPVSKATSFSKVEVGGELAGFLSLSTDLLSKSGRKTVRKEFFPNLGLENEHTEELIVLFDLPDAVFSSRAEVMEWRRLVMIFAFQVSSKSNSSFGELRKQFWDNLIEYLSKDQNLNQFKKFRWDYLIESQGLSDFGKRKLKGFLKSKNAKVDQGSKSNRDEHESLVSSLIFLKKEGFLPWWSPIRSKSSLIINLLFHLKYADKEKSEMLLLAFTKEGLDQLVSDLPVKELEKLLKAVSNTRYEKYLNEFIVLIREKIGSYDRTSSDHKLENWVDSSKKSLLDKAIQFPGTSAELSKLVKESLHYSKEDQLIRHWFHADPRIHKQIVELLNWSPWMYASNLNPGKWKSYVLIFGFEFYLQRKQNFTRDFFKEFLVFLTRSQSQVNWKLVFHQIIDRQDFDDERYKVYKNMVLNFFPKAIAKVEEEAKPGDQVKVNNAGLILCWPFLSVLFSRLGLLEEGKIPEKNQSKAVYLLQNLVFGHYDFPEYELVLNKILIGMKTGQHLERAELSTDELEMTESLLKGMRSNWKKMENASLDAIRETFLQREGTLEFGFDSFILKVPKTGVDVLLDGVSWNIAMIKLPWMEKSLEVKWR